MQQPLAKAAHPAALLCDSMMVDPRFAENSEADVRAIAHGSSSTLPSAQPRESIMPV